MSGRGGGADWVFGYIYTSHDFNLFSYVFVSVSRQCFWFSWVVLMSVLHFVTNLLGLLIPLSQVILAMLCSFGFLDLCVLIASSTRWVVRRLQVAGWRGINAAWFWDNVLRRRGDFSYRFPFCLHACPFSLCMVWSAIYLFAASLQCKDIILPTDNTGISSCQLTIQE